VSVRSGLIAAVCAGAAILGQAGSARAQLINRLLVPGLVVDSLPDRIATADRTTVLGRPRPEYDPLGIRAGRFTIRPGISEGVLYDSNVLGTARAKGGFGLDTQGSVNIATDLGRNGLDVNLSADDVRYLSGGAAIGNQSHTNYLATLSGYQDWRNGRVLLDATAAQLNLLQTSLDSPGGTQPQTYQVNTARLAYRTAPALLVWEPFVRFTAVRYGTIAVAPGQVPSALRDRDTIGGGVIGRYMLAERRNIIVSAEGFGSSYLRTDPVTGSRDYTGATVLAGIEYGPPAFYQFRALAGIETRSFPNRAFKPRTVPVAEVELIVSPTRRSTATATVSRRIDDSSDEASAGFTYTEGRLQLDYEVLHNVLLQTFGVGQRASYLQGGRRETLYGGGAGATWLVNRNFRLTTTYGYFHRESNRTVPYDEHSVLLRLAYGL